MLSKKDFILLKMVFNHELYEAVHSESLVLVEEVLRQRYFEELESGHYAEEVLTVEMIREIKEENEREQLEDDYEWAL